MTSGVDFAVLIATPDLLAQNLLDDLIKRLGQQELKVFAALSHVFSDAETHRLYAGRQSNPRHPDDPHHSQWLAPRLLTAGPSLCLFVRSDRTRNDLQKFVSELKGSSRFQQSLLGQLRTLSPACDRCMSLVHSPDDEISMAFELQLIFGESVQEQARSHRGGPLPGWIFRALHSHIGGKALSNSLTGFYSLVRRGYALLIAAPDSLLSSELLDQLFSEDLPGEHCQRFNENSLMWERLSALKPFARQLHAQVSLSLSGKTDITSYCRAIAFLQLSRVLQDCLSRKHFDVGVSTLLAKSFSQVGFPLGLWEEQQLHVVAAYHAS